MKIWREFRKTVETGVDPRLWLWHQLRVVIALSHQSGGDEMLETHKFQIVQLYQESSNIKQNKF